MSGVNQHYSLSSPSSSSEKTLQQNSIIDSGFVSCASSSLSCCSSMKVAHSAPQRIDDHVKDLQVDFDHINNLDAANGGSSSSCAVTADFNVGWSYYSNENNYVVQQQQQQQQQQQALLYKQPLQYFEQNEDGDTQLHISVYGEHTDIAVWLIDYAPHPSLLDIKNDDCLTALHIAAMTKQTRIIRMLVLAGADTRITTSRLYQPWTSRGNAAIHMACEANDCESVRALTEPLSAQELYWLASNRRMPPALGQDLELRNYDGVTPMHTAIKKGNLEIVKQLIRVGAKVNTVDPRSGFTSLHLAIDNRRRDIVEYMAKEHKSCLNEPTRFGTSSYEICLNVDKQLAEDLVRWGAAPIVRESDSDSYTDEESDSDDESDVSFTSTIASYSDIYQGAIPTASLITT